MFSAFLWTDAIALSTMSPSSVVSIWTSVLLSPPFKTVFSETSLLISWTVVINSAASFSWVTKSFWFSLWELFTIPSSNKSARTSSSERPVASATILAVSANSSIFDLSSDSAELSISLSPDILYYSVHRYLISSIIRYRPYWDLTIKSIVSLYNQTKLIQSRWKLSKDTTIVRHVVSTLTTRLNFSNSYGLTYLFRCRIF